jgi:Zn-dependent protease
MGMGTPIDLGKFFGVQVRIDPSLFLIALIFLYQGLSHEKEPSLRAVLDELTFIVLFFFCILLHEFGHAAGAALFRIRTLDVTLTFFGGYARLSEPPRTTLAEVVVSFAGPAANLAIAAALWQWLGPDAAYAADNSTRILLNLAYANLFLGIFNLLPGYPLDGGNIARALLAAFLPNNTARLIVGYLGMGVGALCVYLGFTGFLSFGIFFGLLFMYWSWMEIQSANSSRF